MSKNHSKKAPQPHASRPSPPSHPPQSQSQVNNNAIMRGDQSQSQRNSNSPTRRNQKPTSTSRNHANEHTNGGDRTHNLNINSPSNYHASVRSKHEQYSQHQQKQQQYQHQQNSIRNVDVLKTPPRTSNIVGSGGARTPGSHKGRQSQSSSPKKSSNKKTNSNRQLRIVESTKNLRHSVSALFQFVKYQELNGSNFDFKINGSTGATTGSGEYFRMDIINMTHANHSSSGDSLVRNVQLNVHAAAMELSTFLADAKAPAIDEKVHEAFITMFQAADCIEQYISSSPPSLRLSSSAALESSDMNTKDRGAIKCAIMVWSDVSNIISTTLLNPHDLKYSPRKATKIKLAPEKVHAIFTILIKPIDTLLGNDVDNDMTCSSLASRVESESDSQISISLKQSSTAQKLFRREEYCNQFLEILRCLRNFVIGYGHNLDSDRHIIPLVERIIVPILSFDAKTILDSINNDAKAEESAAVTCTLNHILSIHTMTIELLVRILRWKQCTSALLAPLVVDVNTRGVEQFIANPLREILLSSVIAIINCDVYLRLDDTSWLCHTCQCLTSLLDNMNAAKMNGGGARACGSTKQSVGMGRKTSDQVQIANIFKWVHKTLQCDIILGKNERSHWWYSLDLLKTLIRLYPESCAQYWSLFLPQYTSSDTPPSSPEKNSPRKRDLMSIIRLGEDGDVVVPAEEKTVAIKCCREIIEALPLDLWSRSGYLMRRIEASLGVVIDTTTLHITRSSPSRERDALYSLSVTILNTIPFKEYHQLLPSAVDLVNQFGRIYNMYGLHGGLGLEETVRSLTNCFGGKENPDGEVTPLPIPVRNWLQQSASSAFISRLFNKMSDISSHEVIEKGVQTLVQMSLFVKVVRSAHWILNDEHNGRMESFLNLTRMLLKSDDSSLKVTGCELLVAFIEGDTSLNGDNKSSANCYNNGEIFELPFSMYIDLYSTLSEETSDVLCSAFSAYSSLRYNEWIVLLASDYNPLKLILPLALEYSGHPAGKVRSEACCALGNIMSILVRGSSRLVLASPVEELIALNIEGTLQVTASATEDSDANVRSMALFAIGNVALDTADSHQMFLLTRMPFIKLCDSTYSRLFDESEKVINNAIRTSGHLFKLANFLLHYHSYLLTRSGHFLEALGAKIDRAILDVTDVLLENRSWKHRLNAKKQAWGACQAFDPIILFVAKEGGVHLDSILDAILHLVKCVENSDEINKKIATSAVNSLHNVQSATWKQLSVPGNGIRGRCLAACLAKVESKTLPEPVKKQLQNICGNVLNDISDEDIFTCINHNDITQENIHYLYGWMVEQGANYDLFEAFGRVMLHNPSIHMDISLAQRFQSRALYASRNKRLKGDDSNDEELDLFDDDGEEDEL